MEFVLILFVAVFVILMTIRSFRVSSKSRINPPEVIRKQFKPLPYYAKQYFFSRAEQEFYNILNAKVDAIHHTVFPKVRLGDFIQVQWHEKCSWGWWARIRSRHVDFLIWDLKNQKVVLAIELDGNSHNSQKAKKVDEFKDNVFKSIGIPLRRVKVGTNFINEADKLLDPMKFENKN